MGTQVSSSIPPHSFALFTLFFHHVSGNAKKTERRGRIIFFLGPVWATKTWQNVAWNCRHFETVVLSSCTSRHIQFHSTQWSDESFGLGCQDVFRLGHFVAEVGEYEVLFWLISLCSLVSLPNALCSIYIHIHTHRLYISSSFLKEQGFLEWPDLQSWVLSPEKRLQGSVWLLYGVFERRGVCEVSVAEWVRKAVCTCGMFDF